MSKLIEKEGKFYKECGVVMLETKNSTNIYLHKSNLYLYPNVTLEQTINTAQYLYITSDDEIKKGDWFYSTENTIEQFKGSVMPIKDDKKIIATTDTSLNELKQCPVRGADSSIKYILPQPSDKFIQSYIDAYNKDEKIDKILVEYESSWIKVAHYVLNVAWNPKLKDNNIIIKKVKDSWTREEVISLLNLAMATASAVGMSTQKEADEWINNNL